VACVRGDQILAGLAGLPPEDPLFRSPRNRAVRAYLHALPPDTRVALYWH
jgi:hypothetical protein